VVGCWCSSWSVKTTVNTIDHQLVVGARGGGPGRARRPNGWASLAVVKVSALLAGALSAAQHVLLNSCSQSPRSAGFSCRLACFVISRLGVQVPPPAPHSSAWTILAKRMSCSERALSGKVGPTASAYSFIVLLTGASRVSESGSGFSG